MRTILRSLVLGDIFGGRSKIEVRGSTLRDAIDDLEAKYGDVKPRLLDQDGKIHSYINIYHNGKDVRLMKGLETPLEDGDELSIFAVVGGG